MRKPLLVLAAALAALFGAALVFVPDSMMQSFGLESTPSGLVLSRDLGIVLLAVAVMNWMARNAAPGPALMAILWANLLVQFLQAGLDSYHIVSGQVNASVWGAVGLHVLLGLAFAWVIRAEPAPST